ncbi:MFS transporter [Xylanimonas protaetiae]|uniref:MFS transporter n=1 Tax=Xylanimonas protaetiae TaxID=2509457 RepID=A0A4P6F547_9MICO|nr:MFS transporter [Xylanimonas protaetiae]QAY70455.1 MFS transporter [Xylanimonas protaetiae]
MTTDEGASAEATAAPPAPPDGPPTPTAADRRRATAALAALSLSTFCFLTIELLPGGLMTVIAPALGTSVGRIGLLVSGYAAVVVIASVPLAQAVRRLPRRQVLVATLALVVLANVASALATGFATLFAARLVAALGHSVFWAVVFPSATALFDQAERGRVVARVSFGTALGPIVGLPVALWVAQHVGWRVAFVVVAVLCASVAVAIWALLPARPPHAAEADRGTQPNRAAFAALLVVTFLVVAGAISTFTYTTAYLLEVTGLDRDVLSPVLVVVGLGGLAGMALAGRAVDDHPLAAQAGWLVVLGGGLVALAVGGTHAVVAVGAVAVLGIAFPAVNVTVQYLTMRFAPGGTDVASAASSATFNLGTAAGTFAAGLLVDRAGTGALPWPAAALVALAVAGTLVLARLQRRRPA